jgi:hypothetical protein
MKKETDRHRAAERAHDQQRWYDTGGTGEYDAAGNCFYDAAAAAAAAISGFRLLKIDRLVGQLFFEDLLVCPRGSLPWLPSAARVAPRPYQAWSATNTRSEQP